MRIHFTLITSLLLSLTYVGIFCQEEEQFRLYNQSDKDVILRIRSGMGENLKVFMPPGQDELKINQEAFRFPKKSYLIINKAALNDPIRIRTWPTSYTPSVDVDEHDRPTGTSDENADNAGPSIIPDKAEIQLGRKLVPSPGGRIGLGWERATEEDNPDHKNYKGSYQLKGNKYLKEQ